MAKALLPRLARDGRARGAPYLGVDAQPIDPALEAALKLPSGRGALIASVEKGSPAEAAGLEPGDVVRHWNGAAVATSEDFKIDAQLSIPGARIEGRRSCATASGSSAKSSPRAAPAKGVAPPHPSSCARTPRAGSMAGVEDFDVQEIARARGGLPGRARRRRSRG